MTMNWPELYSKDRRDSKDTVSLNIAICYATKVFSREISKKMEIM